MDAESECSWSTGVSRDACFTKDCGKDGVKWLKCPKPSCRAPQQPDEEPARFLLCPTCAATRRCPQCKDIVRPSDMCTASSLRSTSQTESSLGDRPPTRIEGQALPSVPEETPWQWRGLQPRPYQDEGFRQAVKENSILVMPTGTGKTLVAAMLIDWYLHSWPCKYVMLATRGYDLAKQHASRLQEKYLPHIADMQVVDLAGPQNWSDSVFTSRLEGQKVVLVGTRDNLLEVLKIYGPKMQMQLSLVIFDEAHHAKGNDAYVQIAEDPTIVEASFPVRIVGLTASPLHGRLASDAGSQCQKLQETLRGASFWYPDAAAIANYIKEPVLQRVPYDEDQRSNGSQQPVFTDDARLRLQEALQTSAASLAEGTGWIFRFANDELDKEHERHNVAKLLGAGAWNWFVRSIPDVAQMLEESARTYSDNYKDKDPPSEIEVKMLQDVCNKVARGPAPAGTNGYSAKVQALFNVIQKELDIRGIEALSCIVFVEKALCTRPLASMISEKYPKLNCSAFAGGKWMSKSTRDDIRERFSQRRCQVVVSTDALEEGLDTPCNVVICFDKFTNSKTHVQRKGRAREQASTVYYFDNEPDEEELKHKQLTNLVRALMPQRQLQQADAEDDTLVWEHPLSNRPLRLTNAVGILVEYSRAVTGDVSMSMEDLLTQADSGCTSVRVHTPQHDAPEVLQWKEVLQNIEILLRHDTSIEHSDIEDQTVYAFGAVALLIQRDLVDEAFTARHPVPAVLPESAPKAQERSRLAAPVGVDEHSPEMVNGMQNQGAVGAPSSPPSAQLEYHQAPEEPTADHSTASTPSAAASQTAPLRSEISGLPVTSPSVALPKAAVSLLKEWQEKASKDPDDRRDFKFELVQEDDQSAGPFQYDVAIWLPHDIDPRTVRGPGEFTKKEAKEAAAQEAIKIIPELSHAHCGKRPSEANPGATQPMRSTGEGPRIDSLLDMHKFADIGDLAFVTKEEMDFLCSDLMKRFGGNESEVCQLRSLVQSPRTVH